MLPGARSLHHCLNLLSPIVQAETSRLLLTIGGVPFEVRVKEKYAWEESPTSLGAVLIELLVLPLHTYAGCNLPLF